MEPTPRGRLRGLILRDQLIVLLKNKVFNETPFVWESNEVSPKMFQKEYPRYPSIHVRNTYIYFNFFRVLNLFFLRRM